MTQTIAALLTVVLSLTAPAVASARGHHVKHHHAVRHHLAHRAQVTGCEDPSEPSWAEWRADMSAAGFSAEQTEALEVCGEDEG